MLIPRSDPTADSCSGYAPCAYDTSTPTDPTDDNISYLPRSGPYGYMGITIVAILAVLACVLWLYLARKRAKQAKEWKGKDAKAPKMPRRSRFGIGKRKLSPSLPLPVASLARDTEGSMIPLSIDSPTHTSTSENGKQPRWVSESGVRKGLVKEVSGGMVVYTAPSKGTQPTQPQASIPPPRRDRYSKRGSLGSGWQMEHLHGVQYEARGPSESVQETSKSAP